MKRAAALTIIGFFFLSVIWVGEGSAAKRKFVIVSVGESYAAGEGNPDTPIKVKNVKRACRIRYERADNGLAPIGMPLGNLGKEYITLDSGKRKRLRVTKAGEKKRGYGSHMRKARNLGKSDIFLRIKDFRTHWVTLKAGRSAIYQADLLEARCPRQYSGARWIHTTCHRSKNSSHYLVYQHLKSQLKDREVVFKSFTCSGAKIDEGLLGQQRVKDYLDPLKPARMVKPQITEAGRWMRQNNILRADVLLMSIGGNDAGFGKVVMACAVPGKSCDDNLLAKLSVSLGLNSLPGKYDQLARAIQTQIRPRDVFITEYPDPVRNSKGGYCNHFNDGLVLGPTHKPVYYRGLLLPVGAGLYNMSNVENRRVLEKVLYPLNRRVRAAAQKHRWHYVGGIQTAFRTHGYCSGKDRWMVTLNDSWRIRQGDPYGVMHPNQEGHRAYARAILASMNQALKLNVPIPK